jgi:hypothetical protein
MDVNDDFPRLFPNIQRFITHLASSDACTTKQKYTFSQNPDQYLVSRIPYLASHIPHHTSRITKKIPRCGCNRGSMKLNIKPKKDGSIDIKTLFSWYRLVFYGRRGGFTQEKLYTFGSNSPKNQQRKKRGKIGVPGSDSRNACL